MIKKGKFIIENLLKIHLFNFLHPGHSLSFHPPLHIPLSSFLPPSFNPLLFFSIQEKGVWEPEGSSFTEGNLEEVHTLN